MPAVYRADQVGSFLRPSELLRARADGIGGEQLRALEDKHILRVLQKQKELGFDIFTDGEFRRSTFMSDFTDAVEGFDFGDAVARTWQAGQTQGGVSVAPVTGIVTGKLRALRRLTGHELPFLKQHSPGAIKMTIPSATQFPAITFKWGITERIYPDPIALLKAVVEIIRNELSQLANEGVNYIQIDAPRYSYYMDPKWRAWIQREMKVDPDRMLEESIQADNACFDAARRPGITLAIHLCRGNNRSHWYAEGGYDAIAEKLFNTLEVDRFLLEYDDERSGTFEPLRFVPKDKTVVLGLVSSKTPRLEDPNVLIKRIEHASSYLPLENLALSPQCGFASTAEGNLLTEDDQWRKLQLVMETASKVWAS